MQAAPRASAWRILIASLIGTTIEYYDFYIYGTAAALTLGPVFFPQSSATAQRLSAFATFAIAFLARPLGAALFGHFGDRVGRKSTLVIALLVMGLSTTLIGVLPGFASLGPLAPFLLCVLRFGQGVGLGGEWGGAALLATEYAPRQRRAWYGMFPQLGAPLGFLLANGLFFGTSFLLSDAAFRTVGWRIPFLLSVLLLAVGLYIRLNLSETPVFETLKKTNKTTPAPLLTLLAQNGRTVFLGALAMVACYGLFYISTVFALGYGTNALHYSREQFLAIECIAIVFMAAAIPLSALAADRMGRRPVLIAGALAACFSGSLLSPALTSGSPLIIGGFLSLELFLMGWLFGPMGALLAELFPTGVRYTGASLAYNLAGILGASFAPYIAERLVNAGGLPWVGAYITLAGLISLTALSCLHETRAVVWTQHPDQPSAETASPVEDA